MEHSEEFYVSCTKMFVNLHMLTLSFLSINLLFEVKKETILND